MCVCVCVCVKGERERASGCVVLGTTVGDMVTQIVTDYIDLHNKIFRTLIAAGHNGAGMGGTVASSFVPKELSGLWQ